MSVIDWLMDSDPAIRWQVMRDLTDAPPDTVAAERARVAKEGWGAQLLAAQDPDGRWSGGTFFPRWVGTSDVLHLLYLFGPEPDAPEIQRAIDDRPAPRIRQIEPVAVQGRRGRDPVAAVPAHFKLRLASPQHHPQPLNGRLGGGLQRGAEAIE